MSFYFTNIQKKQFSDVELLRKLECKVCPLYNLPNNGVRDIKPYGYEGTGGVYILGLGPGDTEARLGKFFTGASGTYLKDSFTEEQKEFIRYNNIVRTRPPDDSPQFEAIESCRPSIERDILLYKPKMIIALGGYPMQWLLHTDKQPSINAWRGHRFPFQIGDFTTWIWPSFHPAYIIRKMHLDPVFKLDIINAYKFLKRNLTPEVMNPNKALPNCKILYNINDIGDALGRAKRGPSATDLETHDDERVGRPYAAGSRILSVSVGTFQEAFAFPWLHSHWKWNENDFRILKDLYLDYLLSSQVKKAHNKGFEIEWLVHKYDNARIARANWTDTMAKAYALGYSGNTKEKGDEEKAEKLFKGLMSLDSLCMVYFGFWMKAVSNVDRVNLDREELDKVLMYNAFDSLMTDGLDLKLQQDIEHENLERVVEDLERRVPTTVLTQREGLDYSDERAQTYSNKIEANISKIYADVIGTQEVIEYRTKYDKFDVGAPQDVAYFFKYLGYNVYKTYVEDGKEKKKLSSDDEILQAISHPLAKKILFYREQTKLKSTYVDIFLTDYKDNVIYPDNKVHASFTTFFTSTGRTSCDSPNLQNFPKRKNKDVRSIIIAPPGYVFASCDFGQIEYRVLVMASKDPKLIKYVWSGKDIHSDWAWRIVQKYPDRVGKSLADKWKHANVETLKKDDPLFEKFRDIVKNSFVFAAFYGAGIGKLSSGLGIPKEVVEILYQEFWEEFSTVRKWHRWAYDFYKKYGYIETLTGRRRYAPLQGGEIINAPIQGGASDIVMDGMNRLSEYAVESGQRQFQPRINIHDDLSFYLPEYSWEDDIKKIIHMMLDCRFPFINVPLAIEASVGPDWYNQKRYGVFDNAEELKARLTLNH